MAWYKHPDFGILVLRYGLGFVFLWFGFSQLHNPAAWTGFLPDVITRIGISGVPFVLFNGLFEVCLAFLLLVGAYTRLSAMLLGVHLIGIAFSVGMTAVGIRDVGLALATLALATFPTPFWAFDTTHP